MFTLVTPIAQQNTGREDIINTAKFTFKYSLVILLVLITSKILIQTI